MHADAHMKMTMRRVDKTMSDYKGFINMTDMHHGGVNNKYPVNTSFA